MESFLKDLLSTYKERLKSTFFSSFVLAWIAWNWRYFYITLFVSEDALGDFANKLLYMKSIDTNSWILLWGPLSTTIAYILLLNPINWGVNSFVEYFKLKAKNTRINIWEDEKFSKKEVDELREIDKKEIKEKDDKLSELEKRLAKKDEEFVDLSTKYKELNDEYEGMYNTYVLPQTSTGNKEDTPKKAQITKNSTDNSYSNQDKARFLKLTKLINGYAFLDIASIEDMLQSKDVFEYKSFAQFAEVRDFFERNNYVELFENKEYAKFTETFNMFFANYLRYIGEGI